jgi:ribosomal protein S13
MIYLFESELPENKSVYFALTHIYGIGKAIHFNLQKVRFSANLKVKIYLKIKLLNL